ncbi:MAG: hypothetical protein U9N14_00940 [Pseudomonadota bacterium]|nr:hypothetical protein [Pseudomonadota bacterium]
MNESHPIIDLIRKEIEFLTRPVRDFFALSHADMDIESTWPGIPLVKATLDMDIRIDRALESGIHVDPDKYLLTVPAGLSHENLVMSIIRGRRIAQMIRKGICPGPDLSDAENRRILRWLIVDSEVTVCRVVDNVMFIPDRQRLIEAYKAGPLKNVWDGYKEALPNNGLTNGDVWLAVAGKLAEDPRNPFAMADEQAAQYGDDAKRTLPFGWSVRETNQADNIRLVPHNRSNEVDKLLNADFGTASAVQPVPSIPVLRFNL